jgi:hypothetical protein
VEGGGYTNLGSESMIEWSASKFDDLVMEKVGVL